jgi:twitching motility protein PilT
MPLINLGDTNQNNSNVSQQNSVQSQMVPNIPTTNTNITNNELMQDEHSMLRDLPPLTSDYNIVDNTTKNNTPNIGNNLQQEKPKLNLNQIQSNPNLNVNTLDPKVNPITIGEKFMTQKATLNELLTIAEKRNASDLHISVEYPPMLRIDGSLVSMGGEVLTQARVQELFSEIMNENIKLKLQKDRDVDFSFAHTSGTRFRVNLFHKKGLLAGAFRLIPSRVKTISELNLPQIIYDLIKIPQGLVILAGPTGSGKSTTIASMIHEINLNYPKHIITLEDPIEYIFPKGKSIINQREIGTDATSFQRALREVLREDPDVVLVGEMRDFETISATITTAETGHLVFSTLHTNSAAQTVDRMIDVFPDAQQSQVRAQLANVLSAVISQRLIPIKGGGRKAVLEIMIATPAIRNAIREGKTYQIDNIIQTNAELGMISLEKSLIKYIREGNISVEEAQAYTSKPEELLSLMRTN